MHCQHGRTAEAPCAAVYRLKPPAVPSPCTRRSQLVLVEAVRRRPAEQDALPCSRKRSSFCSTGSCAPALTWSWS